MNIWILYYSILFLHISILYNFICLIISFFLVFYTIYINYSIQFYFLKYFLIITDELTDRIILSYFSRELENIYCICHNHQQNNYVGALPIGIQMESICQYFLES